MSTINIILGVRSDFLAEIKLFLNGNASTLTAEQRQVFRHIWNSGDFDRLFRGAVIGPNTWSAFNVWLDLDNLNQTPAQAKAILDQAVTDSGGQLLIAGAWWWDTGDQVRNSSDEPFYPIHSALHMIFPDTLVGEPATALTRPTSNAEIAAWLAAGGQDLPRGAGQADRVYA